MTLHDFVAPYEFLIGTWEGPGRGYYPTIEDFQYREAITVSAAPGKPFLKYEQHTTSPDGAAMHTEVGYLRPHEGCFIEFVLAQTICHTVLLEGAASVIDDNRLTGVLGDSAIANTTSPKFVEATIRHYVFTPDRTAVYTEFDMAAVGQERQQRLSSELHKQEPTTD